MTRPLAPLAWLGPVAASAWLALGLPAQAHLLKLFATVEGEQVSGYAFFVGGSRAEGVDWRAVSGSGAQIASGKTDDNGQYTFTVSDPGQAPFTVTVDTHEGHIAHTTLAANRFAPVDTSLQALGAGSDPLPKDAASSAPAPSAQGPAAGASLFAQPNAPAPVAPLGAITAPPPLSEAKIAALVEAAVARQVTPLTEEVEALRDKLRFTDTLSALFFIAGLAGMGLWLRLRLAQKAPK